jgi:FkbM family methyltransferase
MDLRGQVVADVGANVGVLSQFFWDHGDTNTRVISIEPLATNIDALRRRADAAQPGIAEADRRWRVHACAASDREGTVWIAASHSAEHGWNAVVRPPAPGREPVPCHPLSALVPDATIVKLDVEGHEYAILDTSIAAMPAVHTWAIELHMVPGRPLPDTLSALYAHGFSVIAAVQKPDHPGVWYDVTLPPHFGWERIPPAGNRSPDHPDGPVFKMLHIIAKKTRDSVR